VQQIGAFSRERDARRWYTRAAMKLERLAAALAPTSAIGRMGIAVRDLSYDARAVAPGALFFCVPGAHFDGHDFAADAVGRGAVALVVERPLDLDVPQLVVADVRRAMAPAAHEFFGRPTHELQVAGVTGTNGKTTTSFLLYAILDAAGRRPGLLGTIETRVGDERRPAVRTTAEAIDLQRTFRQMLDAGDRSCAMEATSHGSQLHRLDCVRFSVLVFTNLSQDHLDFHGTMDAYFDAKRRLFAPGVPAVVNVGDEWGRRLARELGDAVTFAVADDADIGPEALAGIDLKLRGRFNVENALAAFAAARAVGIDDDAIRRGLESVTGVPGRFETVDEGQSFTVVVDYAHKPNALENVLRTARTMTDGRVICVFGAGGDRDRGKRPLMGRIASEVSDVAIVTSDNPRTEDPAAIIEEILGGVTTEVDVELDRRAAITRAVELAREGDVVVIAGKGHEQGQEIAGRVYPFDDREVAREALRAVRT
jgi:UDP-N-acetylmuramoyl-L-alanyl-D-glutamate--2,6-diaminopimelate ligase